MKILLVSEYWPPFIYGGGEISGEQIAKALAKEGSTVVVLTAMLGKLPREEIKDNVKIYRHLKTGRPDTFWGNMKRLLVTRNLKEEIQKLDTEHSFDAIHFLNTTSFPNFKIGKKTSATINGYTYFCPKGNLFYKEQEVCKGCSLQKVFPCLVNSEYIGKMRVKKILKYNPLFILLLYVIFQIRKKRMQNINRFISLSDFITDLLKRENIPPERIRKIPNILEMEKEIGKEEYKTELNFPKGINIVYVGTLEKMKGVDLLIKAFHEVKKEGVNLILCGDGSERRQLQHIAGGNVHFVGKVDYKLIPRVYQQADVVVIPSLWPEPFPRIVLEATYFGKPIIATKVGGNAEGIIDGKNGFVVPPTVKAIAEAITKIIENKDLRQSMGTDSKKIFMERFNPAKITKETKNFLSAN